MARPELGMSWPRDYVDLTFRDEKASVGYAPGANLVYVMALTPGWAMPNRSG